jgi:hypothetical protein
MLTRKVAGSVWRNFGQPEPGRLLLCSLGMQLAVYGVTLDSQYQGRYCYAHLESSWQCMASLWTTRTREATVMLIWKAAGSVWHNFGQPEPGRLLLCSLGIQLAVYGVTLDSQNQGGYCYAHLESSWQCMA